MNKKSVRLVAIVVAFALVANIALPLQLISVFALDNSTIFKNNSFEYGTTNWTVWKGTSNLNVDADAAKYKSGRKSLRVYSNSSSVARGSVSQIISVSGMLGKTLQLSQWVQSAGFSGSFQIRIRFLDAKYQSVSETDIKEMYISANSNWQQKKYLINIPNNVAVQKVSVEYIYNNSKGSVWLDDVSYSVVPTVNANSIIKNGGFEEDYSYFAVWKEQQNFSADIDSSVKRSGNSSLKLYSNNGQTARGIVSQNIAAKSVLGKTLQLSQWVQSAGFTGGLQIRVKFLDVNSQSVAEADMKDMYIPYNSSWQQKKYSIDVPNNSKIQKVSIEYIYNYSCGKVWIDDIGYAITSTVKTANLIKNGNFEEDYSYFTVWKAQSNLSAQIDNTVKKTGYNSLKIYNNNGQNARGIISQKVNIPSNLNGKVLKVQQWIKTSQLSGDGIKVRIGYYGSGTTEISAKETYILGVSKNQDWRQVQYNVFIPNNSNLKAITLEYIFDNCKGTMWLDDLNAVENTAESNKNIIQNGGFESNLQNVVNAWTTWNDVQYSVETLDKFEGSSSLKVSSTVANKEARVTQYIPITSDILGKNLKLSEWIKTAKANNIYVNIYYCDAKNVDVAQPSKFSYNLSANNAWNKYVQNVKVPNNSNIKALGIEYKIKNITDKVLLDDVRLEPYVAISNITPVLPIVELQKGESKNISFNIAPTYATHKNLNLSSDNAYIATANSQGKITGINNGTTKVKVIQQYEGLTFEIPVIVGGSNIINVNKINNLSAVSGQCISGKVTVNSADRNLTYSMIADSQNGYVDLSKDGSFKYYASSDFVGKDSFAIKIQDTHGNFTAAQFTVNISAKSLNLAKEEFVVSTSENQKVNGVVAVNYSGTSKYQIDTNSSNGVFTINSNGSYSYQPNYGFFGYDNVKVKVTTDNNQTGTINGTIYVAPKASTLKNKLNSQHPRILVNQDRFNNIKTLISTDYDAKRWFASLKKKIDPILSAPVVSYSKPDGVRLVTTSKDYIEGLCFMYKVTGDVKYADRAWKEINNICNYPSWNEAHFLDTSSMAVAAAIGYDWLYSYLNDSQKAIIENAIKDKALKKYALNTWLDSSESNWSIICNSGMIFSSLAIANGTNSDITLGTVENALKSMQTSLKNYYKDGSTFEGAGYWEYATEYLMYADSSLENAVNMKNSFSSILNFKSIAEFPMNITGTNGSYNYADTLESVIPSYFNLWIAKKLNQSNLTQYAKLCDGRANAINIFNLLWYDPQLYNQGYNTALDKYFDENQVVTMRSSFDKDYANFIGVKGGTTGVDHSDLDVGNFVYDALGVRWAVDLGRDNYNLQGYFNDDSIGERWNYYRKRAEGHNTLVIGDSSGADQVVGSTSSIITNALNSTDPYVVLDMTPAYANKAAKVNRKIQLINARKEVVIEDDFVLKKLEKVSWQMHTNASITISSDGQSAILVQDGKSLKMTLLSGCGGKFEVKNATPSSTSPNPSGQNQNVGVKKLVVTTSVKSGKIKIQMTPMGDVNSMKPIVSNGSFEDNLKDWIVWNATGNLNVAVDSTSSKDKKNSVKISNSNSTVARGTLSQQVNVVKYAGKTLKLSQWVKSSDLVGDLNLRLTIADFNWNQIGSKTITKINISGTEEWKLIEYTINIPKNCTYLGFEYLYDNATGTVWMDNVQLSVQ
ncbi:heparinase II/III domain-containing protein [Inconstantimicrobium mannanitabidum]|uniref:Uncharacterized protein n=1 Tax=Inconstantimicrobium mannanitabidum TaxID=1604901 RepID=A0ACB5RFC9_9CLOT|nr:Ig-like domain-containing protein [Clostridium sp. TW13]GKX67809.1 hypothetical protein rsdtw13_30670 [Clostridium sp. TW13]